MPPPIPPPPPPPPSLLTTPIPSPLGTAGASHRATQIYQTPEPILLSGEESLDSLVTSPTPNQLKSPSQLLQEEIRRFRNINQRRKQLPSLPSIDSPDGGHDSSRTSGESRQQHHVHLHHNHSQHLHHNHPHHPVQVHPTKCARHLKKEIPNLNPPRTRDSFRNDKNEMTNGHNHQHQSHNNNSNNKHHHHHNQQQQQQSSTNSQPSAVVGSNNNSGATTTGAPNNIDGNKKSRYILFSQIYLIVHVSITICLSQVQVDIQSHQATPLPQIVLTVYTLYILIVAMIFFMLLRFYASPSSSSGDNKLNELTEQSTILFGATLLGISEITLSGVNLFACLQTEFILVPICKLAFALFMIHFLLTQVIHSECIGIRNVAIAHILATQLSLFILAVVPANQSGDEAMCMSIDARADSGDESSKAPITQVMGAHSPTGDMKFVLAMLANQFKLLTIFILLTIWFTNNQSKINFIRAKLSDEEMVRSQAQSAAAAGGSSMLHDFLLCAPFFILTALTITFNDNFVHLQPFSEIFIQILTSVVSTFGLLIRRRAKYLNPKYQINLLKHHHIIFVSLCFTYVIAFVNIVSLGLRFASSSTTAGQQLSSNTTSASPSPHQTFQTSTSNNSNNQLASLLSFMNWTCLLVQITIQTYLLRLQGKKLVQMSRIFALLVVMNICLWMLNLYSNLLQSSLSTELVTFGSLPPSSSSAASLQYSGSTASSVDLLDRVTDILSMFVTLNRFYCAMIFCHFWRMQQI